MQSDFNMHGNMHILFVIPDCWSLFAYLCKVCYLISLFIYGKYLGGYVADEDFCRGHIEKETGRQRNTIIRIMELLAS